MAFNAQVFGPTDFAHRPRPAQFVRSPFARGWFQDGRQLRHVKASKAFIWPKDGKNGTTWGRMKDVLTGKGPDIFLAFGANKGDCVFNRPTRAQWSGHVNLDDTDLDGGFNHRKFAPWTTKGALGGRMPGLGYDFRTRRYRPEYRNMWTDAVWQADKKENKRNPYPEALRDRHGRWWQDWNYLPQHRGGPIDNMRGRGVPFFHLPHGPPIFPDL